MGGEEGRPAPKEINLTGRGIASAEAFGVATLWKSAQIAERWFHDAKSAAARSGPDARRHEVVFSVCFAESWLFEWARDTVLHEHQGRFPLLDRIFPSEDRGVGIRERWGRVLDRLASEKLVAKRPNYSTPHRRDWERLVVFRNGLVHGDTSRPYVEGEANGPEPTLDDLLALSPGWALATAYDHVAKLREILPGRLRKVWPGWLHEPRVGGAERAGA